MIDDWHQLFECAQQHAEVLVGLDAPHEQDVRTGWAWRMNRRAPTGLDAEVDDRRMPRSSDVVRELGTRERGIEDHGTRAPANGGKHLARVPLAKAATEDRRHREMNDVVHGGDERRA